MSDTEEDENGGEGGEEAASEQGTVSSHPLARNERNIEDEDGKNGSEEGESGDGDDEGSDVSDTVNKGKPEREISPANGGISPSVAIDAISRNLALEWGTDYDIRVNGIAPGPIGDTTGTSKLVPEEIQSLAKDFMPKELGISFIFAGYSFSAIYHPSNIMLCIFF
ncbi:2,4-dienoyl-CoA reductase [(2E)-enoyl-CoA-producing] [Sarracenia purpurea var. burkii]